MAVEGFTYIRTVLLSFAEAPRNLMISLEHDRRQPKAVPLALSCGDLRQLADAALHMRARQHRLRCAADYRQPRPLLLPVPTG